MAINPNYGTGVYNARLPKVDIRLPSLAGGVATPLAFFPSATSAPSSTAIDDLETALDTSLQDIIKMQLSFAGPSNHSRSASESDTGTTPGGNVSGFGLPGMVASAGGTAISTGLSLAGANSIVSSVFGKVGKGLLGEGITDTDMANIAINTAAIALGVPGVALSVLNAIGFNPAQGLGEAFGLYNGLTPGYEGGFFGTQGIGSGLTLGEGAGVGQSNTGAGTSGEAGGSGISTGSGGGISYGGGNSGDGGSIGTSTGTPGYGAGDLGGGISIGAGGGINVGGNFGGYGDSDSSSDSSSDSDSDGGDGGDGGSDGGSE